MLSSLHNHRFRIAIMALFIVPLSGFGIDIYVPSLPSVASYFHISNALVQLTIAMYMLGYGILQFISGNIVDSIGRKPTFMLSMLIYIIASFLIPHVQTIEQLLFLRFIQGACVAFFQVCMRAVMPDLFTGKEFQKMTTYMIMAWSIGPIIAPAIGGYIEHYFGWQANFYFLGAYGVLAIILNLFFIPETLDQKKPFHFVAFMKTSKEILTHASYLSGVLSLGLMYSIMILFGVVASFLIQNTLHYSPIAFGHMALLMGLAWFFGTMSNHFLIAVDPRKKIKIILSCMLVIALIALGFSLIQTINLQTLLISSFVLLYFAGLSFPIYGAHSTSIFPDSKATANALMGVFMVSIPAISSTLAGILKIDSQSELAFAYVLLIAICCVISYLRRKA
jgi:DHA1 family bicyclomycin/chloramphenicol resistance-like MFS transporter